MFSSKIVLQFSLCFLFFLFHDSSSKKITIVNPTLQKLKFNITEALKDPKNPEEYRFCYDNEECGVGEYCDIGEELNGTGKPEEVVKYCFKSPGDAYLYRSPVPELCTSETDCDEGYCKYFTGYGLCVSFPICPHNFAPLEGGRECLDDSQCEEPGKCIKSLHDERKVCCAELYCEDKKTPVFNQLKFDGENCNKAISYNLSGRCCPKGKGSIVSRLFDSRNKCQHGVLVIPEKPCPCQYAQNDAPIKQWCDDESKVCCETNTFEQYYKMYCPDARTPLYLQPKCNGTTSCEMNGGMCVEGQCCPKLIYDEIDHEYKGLPEKSFETEVSCSAENATSVRWAFTFCNVVTSKIWILGKKNNFGRLNVLVPTECRTFRDCDRINNREDQYCVMDSAGESYCVESPFIDIMKSGESSIFHYNLIVTVIFFLGMTIVSIMMIVIMIKWMFERRRRMEQFH